LLSVVLKVLPQHSHKPIVNSVLLPCLSGLPAIFQVFTGFLTSFPQDGHFAMIITVLECYHMDQHKTLAVDTGENVKKRFF